MDRILNVNVSMPGRINPDTGENFTYFDFGDTHLSQAIEKKINIHCTIDNDTRSMAYGEYMKGCVENEKDIIFINLSWGLAIGIIIDGKLYWGKTGFAGEFGHMVIEKNGRQCYCGKRGCMDAYCSALVLQESSGCTLESFFDGVRRGEPHIVKIWDRYTDDLAVAVTNLRMIFDCRIVLGGYVGGYLKEFMPELSEKVMKYNNFDVDTGYLSAGKFKLNASAYGAALRFIEKVFDNI